MVVSTDLENRCLTLFIWHKIEIRDKVRVLTCSLKVRFESKIIPRSLTEDTGICACMFKTTAASMLQTLTYFLIWLNAWKDLLLPVRTPGLKPSQPFHNQYLVYTWQYFKIAGLQRLCNGAIPHNIIIILSHIQEHNPRWLIWWAHQISNLMPLDRITWENAVE